VYSSQEEHKLRLNNFKASLKTIAKLNANSKSAKFDVNEFADLSPEEFRATKLMPRKWTAQELATACLAKGVGNTQIYASEVIEAIPTSWDWRTTGGKDGKGIVTKVKNQGMCGSCWTFSTTGNIESLFALKGNPLTELSEQVIVDCSHGCCNVDSEKVCNEGCDGGFQWNAFSDIITWGGLQTEEEYPYTGETGTCHSNPKQFIAPIVNYTCFSGPNPADEDQLRAHIHTNGPVAIALDALLLQFYWSGIVDPFFPNLECDPNSLDHALLIVGWGQENNWIGEMTPYWIVKNSWGASWGEEGYFKILRNANMCGIGNAVSTAVMK